MSNVIRYFLPDKQTEVNDPVVIPPFYLRVKDPIVSSLKIKQRLIARITFFDGNTYEYAVFITRVDLQGDCMSFHLEHETNYQSHLDEAV